MPDPLREINRALGTLEAQVAAIGKDWQEFQSDWRQHKGGATQLERDGFRRLQDLEARVGALEKAWSEAGKVRETRFKVIALVFTGIQLIILAVTAILGLLR